MRKSRRTQVNGFQAGSWQEEKANRKREPKKKAGRNLMKKVRKPQG